jgi:hypothetical protein
MPRVAICDQCDSAFEPQEDEQTTCEACILEARWECTLHDSSAAEDVQNHPNYD